MDDCAMHGPFDLVNGLTDQLLLARENFAEAGSPYAMAASKDLQLTDLTQLSLTGC